MLWMCIYTVCCSISHDVELYLEISVRECDCCLAAVCLHSELWHVCFEIPSFVAFFAPSHPLHTYKFQLSIQLLRPFSMQEAGHDLHLYTKTMMRETKKFASVLAYHQPIQVSSVENIIPFLTNHFRTGRLVYILSLFSTVRSPAMKSSSFLYLMWILSSLSLSKYSAPSFCASTI